MTALKPPFVPGKAPFFDPRQGEAARDQALERLETAHVDFIATAKSWVKHLAQNYPYFTADDVWLRLAEQGVQAPVEPRALGAVMRAAQAEGWIEPGGFVACKRASRHRAPVRQWKSLLYGR